MAQVVFVSGGVEVQRVHDVGVGQRVGRRGGKILRPGGRPHDDDCIGVVGADDGNDRLGIGLDVGPARAAVGLVAYLVDDIVRVPQGAGHGAEELLGGPLVREGVRIRQGVPVDHRVQIGGLGVLDAAHHQVVQRRAVARLQGVAALLRRVGGQAHHIGAPHLAQFGKKLLVHVLGVPRQAVGGNAAQLHRLAGGIGELGADDLERAGRGRGGRGRDVLFSRSLLRGGIGRSLGLRFQRVLGPLRRLFHHQGIRSSGRGQAAHRRSQGHADAREHHEHRHRDADAREPCPSRRLSHGTLTSRASQPAHFQGLRGPLVLHQARHCTPPRAPA